MKDLLTDPSNQSHLVGIPKTDPSHIPVQKVEDNFLQYPRESCYSLSGTVQTGSITLTLPVQLTKQTTMNWQNLGLSPEDHEIMSTVDQRIDSSTSDFTSGHQNHIKDKNRNFSISPPSTTSSIDDPQQNMLSSTENSLPNKQMSHSKLNCDLEIGILVKDNACNKISTGVHTMQNFPGSVVSKLNVVQQKPTAYVRPMDGQDQVPSESPKLKSSIIINRGLSIKSDGDRMQSDKRDTFVDPNLEEDNEHTGVGFFSSKHGDLKVRSPTSCPAEISTLADDLKLSSDEEDIDQPTAKGQATGIQSNSGVVQECSGRASRVSIKGSSSSSSESDTSSESDSESASSSSESENSKPSGYTSEPEQRTSNKWQLDKWLNKVNPHKSSILSNTASLCYSGIKEGGQDCDKVLQDSQTVCGNSKTRSPGRNDQRTPCTIPASPAVTVTSSVPIAFALPSESPPQRRAVCRKLTRRAERTSGGVNQNCNTPHDTSLSQGNDGPELTKNRLICSRGLHRKEPRTVILGCESRRTRALCRSAPKSKEFPESSTQSSGHGTETELEVSPAPRNICATTLTVPERTHGLKSCESNNICRPNLHNATGFCNSRTRNNASHDLEEQYYTLVPFGRNENVHSLKGTEEVKSLWVRIDLTLLSRIPEKAQQELIAMNSSKDTLPSSQSKRFAPVQESSMLKMRRKRKYENESSQDMKKNIVEKDDPLRLPLPVDSSEAINGHSTNLNRDEISAPGKSSCGDMFSSSSRNRRAERRSPVRQRSLHIPSDNTTVCNREDLQTDHWSPGLNGHKDSRRTKLLFDSTPRNADHFMQEAKRMKHKADAMMDKFDKVLNYTEAALSFIECGNAMEHGPIESKSPYAMYSETVELIRYALRLKSHSAPNASTRDKKITALCYRCLALLYWRMFRLKRDHAVKYSKALIEYFKGSSKVPRAPSPWSTSGKTTGAPSPMSSNPSPVNHNGSHGSIHSTGAPSSTSIISIPQRIHQMAANHVSITNSILHSYDYWEIADKLAKDNIEFFNELDTLMGPITLHSSMEHLVQYTRQGLHWVRHSAHLL
ncbi:AF4/FMR2 family member 3 isoform X2 [Spea bombifrons]|nr:AF4/FMR2 family member 3 isoform X2 [Spea bombifrons]